MCIRDSQITGRFYGAMQQGELEVYLQPKFNLEERKIYGAEALARWRTKTGEMIMPGRFVPPLENIGYVVDLDFYIYEMCIRDRYGYGETSRQALEKARKTIAGTLEAKPSEIFFTSGGSESDNWAVKCIAGEYKHKGKHIITSKIEHHAILNSCKYLEELGYEVTYLDVDEYGMVSPEAVYHAIREDTTLITICLLYTSSRKQKSK